MKRFIKYLFFLLIFGITCITLVGCKEQEKKQDCNNYNMIVNNVEENGIGLKMTKLAATSSSLSNSITINATVNPSNATNKNLSWELSWKTSKNDNIDIYLSKNISSDTLSCTLNYLNPFDTQIILTVSSQKNSEISATCTFDCYKKSIITCNLYVDLVNNDATISSTYPYTEFDFRELSTITKDELISCYFDYTCFSVSTKTIGTINSNSSQTNYSDYVFYLSSDLKNTLSSYGINCKDDYGIVFDENFNYSFEEMFGELTEVDSFTNEFYLSLFECPKWFELRICDNDDVFANFELLFSFENIEI